MRVGEDDSYARADAPLERKSGRRRYQRRSTKSQAVRSSPDMAPLSYASEGRIFMLVFYAARGCSARNVRILRRSMGFGGSEEIGLAAPAFLLANQLHVHLAFWSHDVTRNCEGLPVVREFPAVFNYLIFAFRILCFRSDYQRG